MKKKFKLGFIFITLLSFTLTMIFGLTNPARNTYAQTYNSGEVSLSSLSVSDVTKSGVTITSTDAFDVYIDGATTAAAEGVTSYATTKDYTVAYGTEGSVLKLNSYAEYTLKTGDLLINGVDISTKENYTINSSNGTNVTAGTAKVTYKNGSIVLTLTDFVCEGQGTNYMSNWKALINYKGNSNFVLELIGSNTLTVLNGQDCICSYYGGPYRPLIICGSGSLTINGSRIGIKSYGDVIVQGCTLNINSTNSCFNSYDWPNDSGIYKIFNCTMNLALTGSVYDVFYDADAWYTIPCTVWENEAGTGDGAIKNPNYPNKGSTYKWKNVKFAAQAHNFVYSNVNDNIVATCLDDDCKYKNNPVTLNIPEPEKKIYYDGKPHTLDISNVNFDAFPYSSLNVSFRKDSKYGQQVTHPTMPGTYYAIVSIGYVEKIYEFEIIASDHQHDSIPFKPWAVDDSLPTTAGNYYLTKNVTLDSTWNVPTGTTNLCLNGFGIIGNGFGGSLITASGSTSKLFIYDCGETEHKYSVANANLYHGAGLATVDDTLTENYSTFNGGYITGANVESYDSHGAITATNYAEITINGGTIIGNKNEAGHASALYSSDHGKLTINDGSIIHNLAHDAGAAALARGNGILYIKGGVFENNASENHILAGVNTDGSATLYLYNSPLIKNNYGPNDEGVDLGLETKLNIGDNFAPKEKIGVHVNTSNKVFTSNWDNKKSDEDANDYFYSQDSSYQYIGLLNGELKVCQNKQIARAGKTTYDNLLDAYNGCSANGKIILLDDIDITALAADYLTISKNIVLDLNGKILTFNEGQISVSASLTIDNSLIKTGGLKGVIPVSTGSVILKNARLTIAKDTIEANSTFYDVADGYEAISISEDGNGFKTLVRSSAPVAEISGVLYPTIIDAINDWVEGDTIKLLSDIDITGQGHHSVKKDLVIDLNGHILSGPSGTSDRISVYMKNHFTVINSVAKSGGCLSCFSAGVSSTDDSIYGYIIYGENVRLRTTPNLLNGKYDRCIDGFIGIYINSDESVDANGFSVIVARRYVALDPNGETPVIKIPGNKEEAANDDVLVVDTNARPISVEWFYDDDNDGDPDDPDNPIATGKTYTVKKPKDTGHKILVVIKQDEDENGDPLPTPIVVKTAGVKVSGVLGPYFKVGDITYSDFKKAYDACSEGDVITLIEECDLDGLAANSINVEKNIILDLNGHKLSGPNAIVIAQNKVLSICNTKPETGGVAGGIDYTNSKIRVYYVKINIAADELNIHMKDEWVVAEGYKAVTIKQDQTADENGYQSIVQPIGKVLFEKNEKYTFENQVWFKGDGNDAAIPVNNQESTVKYDGYGLYSKPGYSFVFRYDEYTCSQVIIILSDELDSNPTKFYITGGTGTQADPYTVALATDYIPLDTTKEIILKDFVKDGDVLTVDVNATDLTIEWFYDDNGDGKPDNETPIGTGKEYTVTFVDLSDSTHNDQGHNIIAVVKQVYDENGCEHAIIPTVTTTPAKVSDVFPETKNLASETIYLIGDYINVPDELYIDLDNGEITRIQVGKFKVTSKITTVQVHRFSDMFKSASGDILSLKVEINQNLYSQTGCEIVGIRLISGTGTASDAYKFEAVYNLTYVDLDTQKEIVIKTPDDERNPKDGDELEIYTTSNPVDIEWFYDDDNDGDPDDPNNPIGTGKTYTVKCPDKNDPTHDDTGHTIIVVIKQNQKPDGTDYPVDEVPTVKSKPVLVRGNTKEIDTNTYYLFGDVISLIYDGDIYTDTSDNDNMIDTEIKRGEYVLNRPDSYSPAQAPYDTITFKGLFTDTNGNPKDVVIKFASLVNDIKDVIGIMCIDGDGWYDPYLFVAITEDDLYVPLDTTKHPSITTPNHTPLLHGDEIEIVPEATEVVIKWYYDDNEDGLPDDPTKPLGEGTTYTICCPDSNNPTHDDRGHKIIAVITQTKDKNGQDIPEDEQPKQYSKPVQVYTALDPDDEQPEIEIPGDKDKAENGDEITVDVDITPATIEWYYDDDGDGNPDNPNNPIGTGEKYTVKCPDTNNPTHDDTGHTIIAVIKQDKKPDGTDYDEDEIPTIISKPIVVKGNIGGYSPLVPQSHPTIDTQNKDPLINGNEISIDIQAKPVIIKWYYVDEDGNPTGQPIGEGKTYTVKALDTTTDQDDTGHTIIAVITQTKDEDGDDLPEEDIIIVYSNPVHVYTPVKPNEEIEVKTTNDNERPKNGETIEVDTDFTPITVEWFYDDDGDGNPDDPNNPIGTGNTYTITEPQDTGHTIIGVVTQNKKPDGTDYGQDEEVPTTTTKPIKVHGYLPGEYVPLDPEDEPAPTVPNKPTLENDDEVSIETDASDVIIKWYYDDDGDGLPDDPTKPIGEGKTYTLKCPDANDPTHDDRDHKIIAEIKQKYKENGDAYTEAEMPTQYSKPITNIVKKHEHNFTYTAVGATITAKCTTPGCDITEGLKLTLLAPTGSMVCDDKERVVTIQTGYNALVFGTPVIKYYKGDTEVQKCIDAGTYTAKVTVGGATAQISFTIEAWKPKTDVTPSKDIPASETPNVKVEVEGAGKNDDISVKVEVKTTLTAQETGKDFDKIQTKLESGEKITRVYEVKLLRTSNGVTESIQPSDIKPGTKITVTMTLPEEVLNAESFKILHIHSATDSEFITDYVRSGNTVSFSVSRLSEFAFIIKGKGLAGWAIALIVIDSLLVAMAMAYLAIFFIFNKWIVINGKAIRVLVCGKKEDKTRVVTLFLGIEYRNANEVFNSQEEALGKIE